MNAILEDGYEVEDDKLTSPYNKTRARGDTDQPIYKEGLALNGKDHRRTAGCQLTYSQDKPSARGYTDQLIYKEVWACNDIYHRRTA